MPPFLPRRPSIVRIAQMVVQWVIQAQWRPLLTRWKLIQVWRVRVGVKLSLRCRGRRIFHGSEKKRTGEWNGKDLPATGATKMFPPKPCHPARFVLGARDDVLSGPMTYWQRPHWLVIFRRPQALSAASSPSNHLSADGPGSRYN